MFLTLLTCCFALLLPAVIFFNKWKNRKARATSHSPNLLPPGPKTLPIIGNLHQLRSTQFRSFRELAKTYGPLMHLKFGEISAIVVSSPEIAKVMLKDQDPCFAGRFGSISLEIVWYKYISIAFCDYGEYWRQMRKICMVKLLSAKNVRSFGYIRDEEVSRLVQTIKSLDGKTPINFTEMIFLMSSSITCRASFGKVCKDSSTLISLLRETLNLAAGFCISDLFPSSKTMSKLDWNRPNLKKMRQRLDEILDGIINDHKVNLDKFALEDGEAAGKCSEGRRGNGEFGDDFVDDLLRIKDEEELAFPINNDNIKAVIFDVFAGGTETISTALDWTLVELIRNPHIMAKAQAEVRQVFDGKQSIKEKYVQELKYLKLIVKESLRLHPPVPVIPRTSRQEASINGYHIPAKARILINNWAMQRDPKYWTDPESFKPERFKNNPVDFLGRDFHYLPFGAGKRLCPGITSAMVNFELPLAQLLYHFNWKLPDGCDHESLNMIESFGLTAARKDKLFLVATPYDPSMGT